ncbi:hypothetical protein [Nitrogeniibacter aestuarii]|uniref:hypothetical protein n=1 Tax=Nitrogeniibacter aestuarii TaxID=2815343 RepID=UPI001E30AC1A|nr:hypothetical protein [Nitrogeniibacter aestuarii]
MVAWFKKDTPEEMERLGLDRNEGVRAAFTLHFESDGSGGLIFLSEKWLLRLDPSGTWYIEPQGLNQPENANLEEVYIEAASVQDLVLQVNKRIRARLDKLGMSTEDRNLYLKFINGLPKSDIQALLASDSDWLPRDIVHTARELSELDLDDLMDQFQQEDSSLRRLSENIGILVDQDDLTENLGLWKDVPRMVHRKRKKS